MRRRKRAFRTPGEVMDEDRDPLTIGVATIRLTEPQRALLSRVAESGEAPCTDGLLRTADVLTDWGLLTQHPHRIRITERGHRYLRRWPVNG